MANAEHLEILRSGVAAWNEWRMEHPMVAPDFKAADLSGTNLSRANLSGANLSHANLQKADLSRANLRRANLCGTIVSEANLSRAQLPGTQLRGAKLREADLGGANLSGTTLTGANLNRAHLREANLRKANLSGAHLREANLSQANLSRANLKQADLSGANLSQAIFRHTLFADADLASARGLESIRHFGPSTLDHETFATSPDLPLVFLRGVGLPDWLIESYQGYLGKAIQLYSCFISYSTKDQRFADRLYADLQANGVRCWFAPHDIQDGKKMHEQVFDAIRRYDKLLLILSANSIESEWVKTEIAMTREREALERPRKLFPVRLVDMKTLQAWECFDANTGKDSAREIREYYIPDFSEWQAHGRYQPEFEKLLRDLKPSVVDDPEDRT